MTEKELMSKKEERDEKRKYLYFHGIYPHQKAENLMKSFTHRKYGYDKAMVACRYFPLRSGDHKGFQLCCSIESPEGKVCIPHGEVNQVIKDLVRYKKHFEIPDNKPNFLPPTQDLKDEISELETRIYLT
ncbi:MAG: hypothetical protein AB9919_12265 [Geobacteraceae bacterium]